MEKLIIEILRKIELVEKYKELCLNYCDFERRANLNRKDIEPFIKFHDPHFKYVAKDNVFLKEEFFKEFTVRIFIGFKGGIIDFSYLIWKEGENQNYYKGRIASLTELIDPQFERKVKYKTPIATSLDDFKEIIFKIFALFDAFQLHFKQATKN